jgi:hypothetical protein
MTTSYIEPQYRRPSPDEIVGFYYDGGPHCIGCTADAEAEQDRTLTGNPIRYRHFQLAESPDDQRCADCGYDLAD